MTPVPLFAASISEGVSRHISPFSAKDVLLQKRFHEIFPGL